MKNPGRIAHCASWTSRGANCLANDFFVSCGDAQKQN